MSDIKFMIGCDPEFFLMDRETGKHVSAYGMIPGTKEKPHKVEGGAVQIDGMAVEFNIDPVDNADDFVKNIKLVLAQLREMIDERYEFSFVPVAEFGKDYIDAQPKKAKELGCDPDYNAYTGQPNPVPNGNLGIRTASGHIHIGWTEGMNPNDPGHYEACRMLTKQFDYILFKASLTWDRDTVRSSMYGKPGAFRPKSYGVEYRVLSNAWLNDENIMREVAESALYFARRLLKGDVYYYDAEDDKTIINFMNIIQTDKDHFGSCYTLVDCSVLNPYAYRQSHGYTHFSEIFPKDRTDKEEVKKGKPMWTTNYVGLSGTNAFIKKIDDIVLDDLVEEL